MKLVSRVVLPDGTICLKWIKDDGKPHRAVIPPWIDESTFLDKVDDHMRALSMSTADRQIK